MMAKFPVRAVVFDMDGILLDSERRSQEILQVAAERLGLTLSPEVSLGLVGKHDAECRRYLEGHLGSAAVVEDLIAEFTRLYETEIERGGIPLKQGVHEVLQTLERFDAIIGGEQVANGKPAPDIYLKACRTLGLLPERSLACEDSPAGLEAASGAGLRAVLIPDLVSPTERMRSQAWRVAESLHDVVAIIKHECATEDDR
jgi:beta-phosphoglucomutase-like phosphatase (HAD superfamily)